MGSKIHYSPDMVCPYCGSEEFFVKQSITGTCEYNMRFDMNNRDVYNGELYEGTVTKLIGKYAYCNRCFKRLFPLSELPWNHRQC